MNKGFYNFFCAITFFCLMNTSFAQHSTQSIRGTVVSSDIGSPIPGATVKVTTTPEPIGAISNSNGEFKIDGVSVGRHSIEVSCIGFETRTLSDILIISGKEAFLNVQLSEASTVTEDVTVIANKNPLTANNDLINTSVTNLDPEEINRFAGTRSDPSKMAATSAGVAGNNNMRNDIIIRGNSPLGVLWRVEDVDVPNPNHFTVAGTGGGVFAIINNNMLSNCDFLTGAYPAEYSNSTAGVFDVHLRNGNNENSEHTFQLGLNGVEFGSEGPFSSTGKASYLANFRFVSLKPVTALGVDLSANVIPEYLDGSFKVNLPTSESGIFTIWGLGGYSSAQIKNSDDDIDWLLREKVEDEAIKSRMFAVGLSHNYLFGDNTLGRLVLAVTGSIINTNNEYVWENDSTMETEDFDAFEGRYQAKYILTHKVSPELLFKAGLSYSHFFFDNRFRQYDDYFDQYFVKMDEKGNTGLAQSFIHFRYKFHPRFEANAGLNYQLFTLNDSYAIEPRLSLSYNISDMTGINFAYGLHSQIHPLLYYFYRFRDGENLVTRNIGLDFTKSNHFVLGFQHRFSDNFFIKTDLFYQHHYNVPVSIRYGYEHYSFVNLGAEFSFNPTDSTVNKGFARNYGVEFTFNKTFSDSYYFLVTGTLFRSLYTDAFGKERSSAFDLGHILNILAGKEFKLDPFNKYVLSSDFKVSFIGGRRIIPYDIEKSISEGDGVKRYEDAYTESWSDYFSLDLKIGLNINLEHTTHNIFIAVDNLTNSKNIAEEDWDRYKNVIDYDYQIGLFPYLGYRINF